MALFIEKLDLNNGKIIMCQEQSFSENCYPFSAAIAHIVFTTTKFEVIIDEGLQVVFDLILKSKL